MHPTGFSYCFFPGFLAIFTLLSSNNNNNNNNASDQCSFSNHRPLLCVIILFALQMCENTMGQKYMPRKSWAMFYDLSTLPKLHPAKSTSELFYVWKSIYIYYIIYLLLIIFVIYYYYYIKMFFQHTYESISSFY